MSRTKIILAAALVLAGLAPGVASAQWADPACLRSNHDSRVEGTVLGALGGAVLGDVLGGRHGHGLGAGLGALGGAAVGNGLADARNTPCPSYAPPPPPEYIRESYAPPPPPQRPDDGLMHWAGSLQGRIARDHDAGLLTNGQSRRLEDQINRIRQHVGELRWRSGGYLYPEDVEGLRSQLGGIGHDLDRLEVLGS